MSLTHFQNLASSTRGVEKIFWSSMAKSMNARIKKTIKLFDGMSEDQIFAKCLNRSMKNQTVKPTLKEENANDLFESLKYLLTTGKGGEVACNAAKAIYNS